MKLGAMNNPFNNLIKEIEGIGKNNFDFIDITLEAPKSYYNINLKKIKKTIADYNLDVIGHTAWYTPLTSPLKEIRQGTLNYFKNCLDIFSYLGAEKMSIHPMFFTPHLGVEKNIDITINFPRNLCKESKKRNIKIMLENIGHKFETPKNLKRIFNSIPDLKFHLDIGHANLRVGKNQTSRYLKILNKKLEHVHISDNDGSDDQHLPIGTGNINWKEQINLIKKYKYNKTITLEVFSRDRDYLLISREKIKVLLK